MKNKIPKERDFGLNEFDLVIGRNLERIKGDATIERLAEIMETSVSYAWNLLKGKRRWNTSYLKMVCDHFQCSAASLFEGATSQDTSSLKHDKLIMAYYSLCDDDKRVVDRFLFPEDAPTAGKKDAPLKKKEEVLKNV